MRVKAAHYDRLGDVEKVEGAIREPAEKRPAKGRMDNDSALWELFDLTNYVRERREELGAERSPPLRVPDENLGKVRLGFRSEANPHSPLSKRDRTVSQGVAASGSSW